jgi:hypothetical protein
MPAHHHFHSMAVQTAALFLSLVPVIALFLVMIAGSVLEERRRARKPAPRIVLVPARSDAGAA